MVHCETQETILRVEMRFWVYSGPNFDDLQIHVD